MPTVSVGYFLPQTQVTFDVSRTIACTDADRIVVVDGASPTVEYSADPDRYESIEIAKLNGVGRDTEFTIEYTDDGRLKSINSVGEGKGKEIFDTVVRIAGSIVGVSGQVPLYPKMCRNIRAWGKNKPITLFYRGKVDLTQPMGASLPLNPAPQSLVFHNQLRNVLGDLTVKIGRLTQPRAPVEPDGLEQYLMLPVAQPAERVLIVQAVEPSTKSTDEIWRGSVTIASQDTDTPYSIPIPRAPLFGSQDTVVEFAGSGALTKLHYGSGSGLPSGLEATASLIEAFEGPTAAERASELKARADEIVQQQRLAACLANPDECE